MIVTVTTGLYIKPHSIMAFQIWYVTSAYQNLYRQLILETFWDITRAVIKLFANTVSGQRFWLYDGW